MARFKDVDWNLPARNDGVIETWQQVEIAVLMDIRDELKALNRIMHCSNTLMIPHTLKSIDKKLTKPRRKRKAR